MIMRSIFHRFNAIKASSHYRPWRKALYNTSELVSEFDQNGFIVLRDYLNEREITNVKQWSQRLEQDAFNNKAKGLNHFEIDKKTNQKRICRSEKFVDFDNGMKTLLCSGKIPFIVSECFGEDAVLYKEKLNYKYPFCGTFLAHQDKAAYAEIKRGISLAISIDESSEVSGCLEMAAGRHNEGIIGQNENGIICDEIAEKKEKRMKLIYQKVETAPGDIVLFDGYAPHKSGVNKTENPRRIIYATYNPLSEGDLRSAYYQRKEESMLSGKISFIFDFDGNVIV